MNTGEVRISRTERSVDPARVARSGYTRSHHHPDHRGVLAGLPHYPTRLPDRASRWSDGAGMYGKSYIEAAVFLGGGRHVFHVEFRCLGLDTDKTGHC